MRAVRSVVGLLGVLDPQGEADIRVDLEGVSVGEPPGSSNRIVPPEYFDIYRQRAQVGTTPTAFASSEVETAREAERVQRESETEAARVSTNARLGSGSPSSVPTRDEDTFFRRLRDAGMGVLGGSSTVEALRNFSISSDLLREAVADARVQTKGVAPILRAASESVERVSEEAASAARAAGKASEAVERGADRVVSSVEDLVEEGRKFIHSLRERIESLLTTSGMADFVGRSGMVDHLVVVVAGMVSYASARTSLARAAAVVGVVAHFGLTGKAFVAGKNALNRLFGATKNGVQAEAFGRNILQEMWSAIRAIFGLEAISPASLNSLRAADTLVRGVKSVGQMIQFVWDLFLDVVEGIANYMVGGGYALTVDRAKKVDFDKWVKDVEALHDMDYVKKIGMKNALLPRVKYLLTVGSEFETMFAEKKHNRVQAAMTMLRSLKGVLEAAIAVTDGRRMPVGAMIFGKPQQGKTEFQRWLGYRCADLVAKVLNLPPREGSTIYQAPMNSEFEDGYQQQPVQIVTDAFKLDDMDKRDEERVRHLMYLDSDCFILNMARLEAKGCTPYLSQFFFVSTNRVPQSMMEVPVGPARAGTRWKVLRPHDTKLTDWEAYARRFKWYVEVQFNPKYLDEKGKVRAEKVDPHIDDWESLRINAWQLRAWDMKTEKPCSNWMSVDVWWKDFALPVIEEYCKQVSFADKHKKPEDLSMLPPEFKRTKSIFGAISERLKARREKKALEDVDVSEEDNKAEGPLMDHFKVMRNQETMENKIVNSITQIVQTVIKTNDLWTPEDERKAKEAELVALGLSDEHGYISDILSIWENLKGESRPMAIGQLYLTITSFEFQQLDLIRHTQTSLELAVGLIARKYGLMARWIFSIAVTVLAVKGLMTYVTSAVKAVVGDGGVVVAEGGSDALERNEALHAKAPNAALLEKLAAGIIVKAESVTDKKQVGVKPRPLMKFSKPVVLAQGGLLDYQSVWRKVSCNVVKIRLSGESSYCTMISPSVGVSPYHVVSDANMKIEDLSGNDLGPVVKYTADEEHDVFAFALKRPVPGVKDLTRYLLTQEDLLGDPFTGLARIDPMPSNEWGTNFVWAPNGAFKDKGTYSLNNGEVVQMVGMFSTVLPHGPGYCGLPYVSINPRRTGRWLIGIHTAGDAATGRSYGRFITKENVDVIYDLLELPVGQGGGKDEEEEEVPYVDEYELWMDPKDAPYERMTEVWDSGLSYSEPTDTEIDFAMRGIVPYGQEEWKKVENPGWIDARCGQVFEVPRPCPISTKQELGPSLIQDKEMELFTRPSPLDDPELSGKDIALKLTQKFMVNYGFEFDTEAWSAMEEALEDTFARVKRPSYLRPVTWQEALTGVDTWLAFSPAVMHSSVGYDLKCMGFKSRWDCLIDPNEKGSKMRMEEDMWKLVRDTRTQPIGTVFYKSERLPAEEVIQKKKVRAIVSFGFTTYLHLRRWFAPLHEALAYSAVGGETAIGIDMLSERADAAFRDRIRDGQFLYNESIDHSGFDNHHHRKTVYSWCKKWRQWHYDNTGEWCPDDEFAWILGTFLKVPYLFVQYVVVLNRFPSGNNETQDASSMIGASVKKACWLLATRRSLTCFHAHNATSNLGDDDDHWADLFAISLCSLPVYQQVAKRLGYEVVSPTKSLTLPRYYTLEESMFLKRIPVRHIGRWFFPLHPRAIHDIPYWIRVRGSNKRKATQDNIDSALVEYSLWELIKQSAPKELYVQAHQYHMELKKRARKAGFEITATGPTWWKERFSTYVAYENYTPEWLAAQMSAPHLVSHPSSHVSDSRVDRSVPKNAKAEGGNPTQEGSVVADAASKPTTTVQGETTFTDQVTEKPLVVEDAPEVRPPLLPTVDQAVQALERKYPISSFAWSTSSSGAALVKIYPGWSLLKQAQIITKTSYNTWITWDHIEGEVRVNGSSEQAGSLIAALLEIFNPFDFSSGVSRTLTGYAAETDAAAIAALTVYDNLRIDASRTDTIPFKIPWGFWDQFLSCNPDDWGDKGYGGFIQVGVMNPLITRSLGTTVQVEFYARLVGVQLGGSILAATTSVPSGTYTVGQPERRVRWKKEWEKQRKQKVDRELPRDARGESAIAGTLAQIGSELAVAAGKEAITALGSRVFPKAKLGSEASALKESFGRTSQVVDGIVAGYGQDRPTTTDTIKRIFTDGNLDLHYGSAVDVFPRLSVLPGAQTLDPSLLLKGEVQYFDEITGRSMMYSQYSFTNATAVNTVFGIIPITPCLQTPLTSAQAARPNPRELLVSGFEQWRGPCEMVVDIRTYVDATYQIGVAWAMDPYSTLPAINSTIANPTDVPCWIINGKGSMTDQRKIPFTGAQAMKLVEQYDASVTSPPVDELEYRNGYAILYVESPVPNVNPITAGTTTVYVNVEMKWPGLKLHGYVGTMDYPGENSVSSGVRVDSSLPVNAIAEASNFTDFVSKSAEPIGEGHPVDVSPFVMVEDIRSLKDLAHIYISLKNMQVVTTASSLGIVYDPWQAPIAPMGGMMHMFAGCRGGLRFAVIEPGSSQDPVALSQYTSRSRLQGQRSIIGNAGQKIDGVEIPYFSSSLYYNSSETAALPGNTTAPALRVDFTASQTGPKYRFSSAGSDDIRFYRLLMPMAGSSTLSAKQERGFNLSKIKDLSRVNLMKDANRPSSLVNSNSSSFGSSGSLNSGMPSKESSAFDFKRALASGLAGGKPVPK